MSTGILLIAGCVGEMSICPDWTDSMTHSKLSTLGLFNRARLCAVSHIAAASPEYRAKLDAAPDLFEYVGPAGPMQVYRVRAPLRWAVATDRTPAPLAASPESWQDIMKSWEEIIRLSAGRIRCPFVIRSDGPAPPPSLGDGLLDSDLDAPCRRVAPGHMVIKVPPGATGVFVKESYFPNFRATLDGRDVPIHLAAPNMMYVPVDGPGRLEVRFVTDGTDWAFLAVSAAALVVVVLVARRFDRGASSRSPSGRG